METTSGHGPRRLRRFAIPAVIVGSLILNGVLLRESLRKPDPLDVGIDGRATISAREGDDSAPWPRADADLRDGERQGSETATSPPSSARKSGSTPVAQRPDRRAAWSRPAGESSGASGFLQSGGEDHPSEAQRQKTERSRSAAADPSGEKHGQDKSGGEQSGSEKSAITKSGADGRGGDIERVEAAARNAALRADGAGDDSDRSTNETSQVETDPDSDRTPPVLLSLRIDPAQIGDGNGTNLLVEINDDLSGVKSVAGRVRSPSGKALIPFEAQAVAGSLLFTAGIQIPPKAETGVWYVSDLFAYDQARNPLIVNFTATSVPPGGRLLVSSADSDSAPPTVRDLWIEPSTVRGGERATLRIDIEDDRSGVANIWGTFKSRSGAGTLNFTGRPSAGSSAPGPGPVVWEGLLPIPANADCGEWRLQQLWVADKAGNSVRLAEETPVVSRTSFYVSSDSCDSDAPVLEWLQLSPTIVTNDNPTEIRLTASVHDEGTGAAAMLVSITGPGSVSGQAPRISLQCARSSNEPDATWVGTFVVPQFAARGIWRVAFVRLQDRASNIRDYRMDDPAIAQAVFEVR